MLTFIRSFFRKKVKKKLFSDRVSQVLAVLSNIRLDTLSKGYMPKMAICKLNSPYKNIEAYSKALKTALHYLQCEDEAEISSYRGYTLSNNYELYYNEFLNDIINKYNVRSFIQEFLNDIKSFLIVYDRIERKEIYEFIDQKKLKYYGKLFVYTCSIVEQLASFKA